MYQKFLHILQRYKEEGFAIAQVKAQVRSLPLSTCFGYGGGEGGGMTCPPFHTQEREGSIYVAGLMDAGGKGGRPRGGEEVREGGREGGTKRSRESERRVAQFPVERTFS